MALDESYMIVLSLNTFMRINVTLYNDKVYVCDYNDISFEKH